MLFNCHECKYRQNLLPFTRKGDEWKILEWDENHIVKKKTQLINISMNAPPLLHLFLQTKKKYACISYIKIRSYNIHASTGQNLQLFTSNGDFSKWVKNYWVGSLTFSKKKNMHVYLISKYKIIQHTCTTSSSTVEQSSTQSEVRWNPAILINWKKSGSIIWLHCLRSRPCSFLQLTIEKKNYWKFLLVNTLNLNILTTDHEN